MTTIEVATAKVPVSDRNDLLGRRGILDEDTIEPSLENTGTGAAVAVDRIAVVAGLTGKHGAIAAHSRTDSAHTDWLSLAVGAAIADRGVAVITALAPLGDLVTAHCPAARARRSRAHEGIVDDANGAAIVVDEVVVIAILGAVDATVTTDDRPAGARGAHALEAVAHHTRAAAVGRDIIVIVALLGRVDHAIAALWRFSFSFSFSFSLSFSLSLSLSLSFTLSFAGGHAEAFTARQVAGFIGAAVVIPLTLYVAHAVVAETGRDGEETESEGKMGVPKHALTVAGAPSAREQHSQKVQRSAVVPGLRHESACT